MNLLDACKPLLIHVAHLSLQAANPHAHRTGENAARDISQLILSTTDKLHHFDDESRHLTWFAINLWLTERLTRLPAVRGLESLLDPIQEDADETFFRNMRLLLNPDAKPPEATRTAIIEVYTACLELGMFECRSDPIVSDRADHYRALCRQELNQEIVENPTAQTPTPDIADTRGGMAALWLFPVAMTILLYVIYRTVLSHQFQSVVG